SVALAFAVVSPAVGLVIEAVHWPAALVVPFGAHVPPLKVAVAPFEFVSDVVTDAPAAGPKPVTASPPGAPAGRPSSCCTVTVNVCVAPTSFVPLGAIEIRASTTCSGSHGPVEGRYSASPR